MGAPEIGSSTAEEMEEKSSRRMYISVILNLVNFLLVVWSVGSMLVWRGTGNMQVSGSRAFMYFTVDSNVLCAIASLLIAGCQIRREVPPGIFIFKYVGTTAVTVTLMTVLLFLGPVLGYGGMFSGINRRSVRWFLPIQRKKSGEAMSGYPFFQHFFMELFTCIKLSV